MSETLFRLVWSTLMAAVGLRMFFAPVYAMWKAERVFYVVSDKGAIIFEKVWSVKIQFFHASGFGGFERISRSSQNGDIIFDRKIERAGKSTKVTETGFIGLKDYADAERALAQMISLNRKSG